MKLSGGHPLGFPYRSVRGFQEFLAPERKVSGGRKGHEEVDEYLAAGVGTADIEPGHVRHAFGGEV